MKERFSIIIPVYNVERYLRQCIDSVLKQTYTNYEILLINDGSTDASASICEEFAKSTKSIKVIHQENQGLSVARNKGIENAKGEYLIFLDSDDYWDDETALQEISKIIDETKSGIVTWSFKKFIEDDNKVVKVRNKDIILDDKENKTENLEKLLKNSLYRACACDKAVKRNLLEQHSIYFKVGDTSEDIEWAAQLMVFAEKIVVYTNDFYVYRQRRGSITKSKNRKNIDDLKKHIVNCIQIGETIADEKLKKVYLAYVAEQYTNMLIVFAIDGNNQGDVCFAKKNRWLLRYAYSKRAKICGFMMAFVGVRGIFLLLNIASRFK